MYTIYVDGEILYSPVLARDGWLVLNPKLTLEMGKAGSLTFLLPTTNPMYDRIMKLKSIITVYQDDEEIFRGRVLHDEKDFRNCRDVYCEGELSFLLDSIQRPYSFTGDIPELFYKFIDSHNEQVDEEKRFIVGDISVTDPNKYINRSGQTYPKTLDAISSSLLDTHGGYLRTRLADGNRYIDLVKEYGNVSSQVVEFGVNMLDITEYITAEDVFTVLIPLGAEFSVGSSGGSSSGGIIYSPTCESCGKPMILDTAASESGDYWVYKCEDCGTTVNRSKDGSSSSGTEDITEVTTERLTIESVNDGKDYIEDEAAISLFGRISRVQEWDDVTEASNLLTKGRAFLESGIEMAVTLTMKAVDLHLVDVDTEKIGLGDYVRVISTPHNLDRYFLCAKMIIDLVSPDKTEYTLGVTYTTMTEKQASGTKVMQSTIAAVQNTAQGANSAANKVGQKVDSSLTQTGIFKILSNNSAVQGMILDESTGDIYINASYIKSGTLTIGGVKNETARLEILDKTGAVCVEAGTDGIKIVKGEINATSGSLESVTIVDGITISTKDEAIKDLSLVKITESDNGAGTSYCITIGESTTRSTPISIEGSTIAIKGASALTFSADNIIFENTIEAPTGYFDDIHVGNAVHFDMDNAEKQIYFKTNTSSGTYSHNCKIYGGNASSKIALAVHDYINSKRVIAYDDVSKQLVTDLTKLYFGNTTDEQKNIYMYSTDSAKNVHQCKIYGGEGSSTTGIGIHDVKNTRDVWVYNDVDNVVKSESKLYSKTLTMEIGPGATALSNQSIDHPFLRMINLHIRVTTADIAANTIMTVGTIAADYSVKGFAGSLSAYTVGTVCAAYITVDGDIKIKAPNAIASGSKIYIDGCWIY